MAKGVKFDEYNDLLLRPPSMTPDQCYDLPVLRTVTADPKPSPVVISCWELSPGELAEVNKTGRIWLTVLGETAPPICVDGIKDNVLHKE